MTQRRTAIVWFRRDLRLHDQPALEAALREAERIVAVYIHAPGEEAPWVPGGASRWWLHHSLAALAQALEHRQGRLNLLEGPSLKTLLEVVAATGAQSVHWTRLYEPALIERDRQIKAALRERGVDAHSHSAALIAEPWTIKTQAGQPYRVFTPYWRALTERLQAHAQAPAPLARALPCVALDGSLPLEALGLLPQIAWDTGLAERWRPGEDGALTLLRRFGEHAVQTYAAARDLPASRATSELSPHLHFGEISPRQVLYGLRRALEGSGATADEGASSFTRELVWREFAHHLLFHFPHSAEAPLNARFAAFPWREPRDYAQDLRAWQRGRSGIPLVDAGMRQLWTTGWMHNRVRLVVASFLTKNLLIPWQEGARWFWDTLVDANLASNSMNWQWVAGSGADAAPYFRIFNPVTQSEKFDPQGEYIRRWVPELAHADTGSLHAPWRQPAVLARTGYPAPIVDLGASRQRALDAYERLRGEAV